MPETKSADAKMKAAWIARFGDPDVLELREVDRPSIDSAQVLVRVRASALNRADLLQRQGKYPPPPGYPVEIPGMEFAGEVAEIGSAVKKWKPGQRVFGLLGGAAHAEFVATHEDLLVEIPKGMSWTDAAAIPEAFITAHDALWTQAQLRPGETVLINAVGSGVGLAAVCGYGRRMDRRQRHQRGSGSGWRPVCKDLPEANGCQRPHDAGGNCGRR